VEFFCDGNLALDAVAFGLDQRWWFVLRLINLEWQSQGGDDTRDEDIMPP